KYHFNDIGRQFSGKRDSVVVSELTVGERQWSLAILVLLAFIGLVMAAAGASRGDELQAHGFIVLLFSLGFLGVLLKGYLGPEPSDIRLESYYDDPSKAGVVFAMAWAVFAMFIGDWVAWLLAYPEMTFDAAWASFGRLRPVHTTGVIFGFGGNALIATSLHVMQRTGRTRLPDQLSPWF